MAAVVRASFSCAARIKGILALRPSRVRMTNGSAWIQVPNKGYKAASVEKKEPLVWQKLCGEAGKFIVDKAKDTSGDELLFPVSAWRLGQLRRVVRESAKDLGWPEDLQFRVHSLRHGGVQWLLAKGASEEELPAMGPGVRKRYAETNDSRSGRGEAGSEVVLKKKRLEKT
jgi:integrase